MLILSKYQNNDLVFCNEFGGYLDPDAFTKEFQRVIERAGLPHMRLHDLRHTFATLALERGAPVKAVSESLGHYSAGFTMDTYAHVTNNMRKDVAEKISEAINAALK